jgi:hypothetical protein
MIVLNEMQRSPEQIAAIESLARRVASAPQLHGSLKLREFFLYVVDCALREVPEEATEQHIGVHVFHRPPGYSSGDDSIVRSQARLLRAKLAAYFAAEGIHEPIIIEIPKGQYLPVFRNATEPTESIVSPVSGPFKPTATSFVAEEPHPVADYPYPRPVEDRSLARARWIWNAVLCVLIALAIGAVAGYMARGHADYPATPTLDAFWKPFYASDSSLVIYSNPAFIGNPSTGLRLLQLAAPDAQGNVVGSAEIIDETYTGTGEAAAINILTRLFDVHGMRFTLKRSRLVTWDEARSRSLIFVGAPSQNTALNDLQTLTQFRIAETPEHRGYIVNAHPREGEPASYPMQTPTEETAIVALLPGLQPDTRIAIFSGLSTVGTQGAVEFFSQPEAARILINRIGTTNGTLKPFEVVLQINTSKGVAMGASFLAIHPH